MTAIANALSSALLHFLWEGLPLLYRVQRLLGAAPREQSYRGPRKMRRAASYGGSRSTVLPEPARSRLLESLSIHEGDTVTPEALDAVKQAVRGFDEHLESGVLLNDDGDAVLRINVPGFRQ